VKDEKFAHVFISQYPIEKIFLSPKSSNNAQVCLSTAGTKSKALLGADLSWVIPKSHPLPKGTDAESIVNYVYAILHSPEYRSRYAEFLKIDFPRIPVAKDAGLFSALTGIGAKLIALHLLEPSESLELTSALVGSPNPIVRRVGWSEGVVWLDSPATKKGHCARPGTSGFSGVPEATWNFHVGGYQVCDKWLKDRKGRRLSTEETAHYVKVVAALSETIRLMEEIDSVTNRYGGWPAAFQTIAL